VVVPSTLNAGIQNPRAENRIDLSMKRRLWFGGNKAK
jgi:hypothetical protein